jgi:hypothetical protein
MIRYALAALALLLLVPASFAQTKKKDIGDVTSWFHSVVIQPDESADDIVCFGCNVRVLGEVRDDIVTMGGNIELEGNVGDDAVAFGGRVHASSNVRIGDEADAFGGYVTADPGARVPDGGESIFYFFLPGQPQPPLAGFGIIAGIHALFVFVFALILRRRRVENIFETMRTRKGWVLLWGAAGWIAAMVLLYASLLIDDTRLGGTGMYILAGIVLLVLAVTVNSGLTGVSVWLGRAFSWNAGRMKAILIGTIVILLLEVVPLAGFAAFALLAWLSMGAALASRWGSRSRELPFRPSSRGVVENA